MSSYEENLAMHRVMRRGALVADCVVLWLRFAEAADLDRYCACCRAA